VVVIRAGNRYTTLRTSDVDVVLLLDEGGQHLDAAVLQH